MSTTQKKSEPSAPEAEAKNDKTASLEFRGLKLTVARNYADWPVELLESIEEGKTIGICRGALGPAQWQRIRRMNLTVRDLEPLADSIADALGFGGGAGE